MDTGIDAGRLQGTIPAISSKSYVHRLMIAAALSGERSIIKTNIKSEDMRATMNCLNSLGADIKECEEGFDVVCGVSKVDEANLDCNESGSTARFLLPLMLLFTNRGTMTGRGKLPKRPFSALVRTLCTHNANISSENLPMRVSGELFPGEFILPGNVSSQFISGLLFALPLLDGDSTIRLSTDLESSGYVRMTLEVLSEFGVYVKWDNHNLFKIPGNQTYKRLEENETEGDWSNSAFLLSMGAVKDSVSVSGLRRLSTQGDREIVSILKNFGASVSTSGDTVTVKKKNLEGITVDVSDIPDLFPAITCVAAFANKESRFINIGRIREKESDRVEGVRELLSSFGVSSYTEKTSDDKEVFVVCGRGEFTVDDVVTVDSKNDHRMVMAAAIMSRGTGKTVIVKGSEAINKSYPGFFELFKGFSYGLIGEKLGHSFSVELHNALGNSEYVLNEIPKNEIEAFFEKKDFKAINVTIPYKEIALKHCMASDAACEIGSVNTMVKKEDGSVMGYNTDYLGFMYMLSRADIDISGKKVAVLGSGGTSKTAKYVAKCLGASSIVTVSRNGEGESFAKYDETDKYKDAEVIINTTPVGMSPDVDGMPVALDIFEKAEAVVDVVYNPLTTRLVGEAVKRGLKATNGLPMLAAQGWYASELFKGHEIHTSLSSNEKELLEKLISDIYEKRKNIVYIGMPGSGKTTLGKKTAAKTGRRFIDTDEEFTKEYKMTPEECSLSKGEPYFRELECKIVKKVSVENSVVIATGGGVILNPENVRLLKQNGKLVYIERPLSELATDGRPLSADGKLKALYEKRHPLYIAAADEIIDLH